MQKKISQIERFVYAIYDLDSYGEIVEIPEELLKEYERIMGEYYNLQGKLGRLYND